ncbi:MAG: protein kinase [Chloroflexaceae bacterium]|nr:protein kinase [Chloroflexaceae bacterium]
MTHESDTGPGSPLVLGRYRVQEQVGVGRLTSVYRATDERLQRYVLMHVLRKDLVDQEHLRERLIAEISVSAQRSHPALLEVFDSGEINNRPFMVTEYVQGRPLSDLGVLALEDALLFTRQVIGATTACVARRLPHPPISSKNVLLIGEGQVKLVENWHLPPAEVALDLAHYRAPELTSGEAANSSSVVYSLGILLYELVTGTRPVSGSDAQMVAQEHQYARIPPLSQVRPLLYLPTLESLLARATARLVEQRIPDVILLGEEIDLLWRNLSTDTQRLTIPPSPRIVPASFRRVSQATTGVLSVPPMPDPFAQYDPEAAGASPWSPPASHEPIPQPSLLRNCIGWLITIIVLLGIAFGSYTVASLAVERVFAIKIPQPKLPDLGLSWPEWLPGFDGGEVLMVNINEGLNLRDAPGLSTRVIAVIRNEARVRQMEDPQVVDNVEWVRVRARAEDVQSAEAAIQGKTIEGWMSLRFLKPEPE